MEVELGLKITRTSDNITSISDFQFAKDRAGPIFLSQETVTKFILTAHLKGYKKENVSIMISEDGTQLSVCGEKAVQEMSLIPFKKEEKIKGFKKKFKIPDGVHLDLVKAKYNEEESLLTIVMPKMAKGIRGTGIEELKEEEVDRGTPEPEQGAAEPVPVPEKPTEETNQERKRRRKRPRKPCPPLLIGGSSLLVSLIFLVMHFIRSKK